MKRKIFVANLGIIVLCLSVIWMITLQKINASKVVDIVQSNYKSITVNDKHIEAGTGKQYLIDDFIPKLSTFTIRTYKGELPKYYTYKVDITREDGSQITLYDNDYLIVDNRKYKILEGTINVDKFYNVFMN